MRNTIRFILTLLFSIWINIAFSAVSDTQFNKPDRDYAPMVWWHWINGNITKDGIRKDLLALHKVGIRGVQVFNVHMYMPEGFIQFGSAQWVDITKFAIEICDSLDMKFVLTNAAGWSGSGGPWVTQELAMKKLTFSETNITGGTNVIMVLPQPTTVLNFYKDVATIAVPTVYPAGVITDVDSKILMANGKTLKIPVNQTELSSIPLNQVIDVSTSVDSKGILTWDAPAGNWTIIRFGYTLTGKQVNPAAFGGEGFEVDKLDKNAVTFQFDQCLGGLFAQTSNYLGKTFEGLLIDSYESDFQNWTSSIPDEFLKRKGYSLIPYLPLFTGRPVVSVRQSEQVLFDFRALLDELVAQNYYGTMQRKANENKLILYAEGQGGPISPNYVTKYIDVPMNEFWNPDSRDRLYKMRLTSSLGNLQGKNIIAAEAFTSTPENGKWQNTPWTMKRVGDIAFAGGINRFCFHTFTHQPYDLKPGFTMGRYGTIMSRNDTWWDYTGPWIDYITRSQYLLQQGETVTDIAFLFHDDVRYNFAQSSVKIPDGFTYDIIYPKDLLEATFLNGQIVLQSGCKYRLISMTENALIPLETLRSLYELVSAGALLIGAPSEAEPSYAIATTVQQDEYSTLVTNLYKGLNGTSITHKTVGKGMVYWGKKIEDVLSTNNIIPDINFGAQSGLGNLYYLHRTLSGQDIYFICSQSDTTIITQLTFRGMTGIPQLWDAATGEISAISTYSQTTNGVKADIELDSYGSCFVVFGNTSPAEIKSITKNVAVDTISLRGKWKLSFDDKRQMKDTIELSQFQSWHQNADNRIKYYSGSAFYTNSFELQSIDIFENNRFQLKLTDLFDIAEVAVNGHNAGIIWKKPYQIDLTQYLQSGINNITIKVANKWINRLIGDEQSPSDLLFEVSTNKFTDGRITQFPLWLTLNKMPDDRQRQTFVTWRHYFSDSPLVPSGLIGTVAIEKYRTNSTLSIAPNANNEWIKTYYSNQSQTVSIDILSPFIGQYSVELVDLFGRTLQIFKGEKQEEKINVQLPVVSVVKGVYIIRTILRNKCVTDKTLIY